MIGVRIDRIGGIDVKIGRVGGIDVSIGKMDEATDLYVFTHDDCLLEIADGIILGTSARYLDEESTNE